MITNMASKTVIQLGTTAFCSKWWTVCLYNLYRTESHLPICFLIKRIELIRILFNWMRSITYCSYSSAVSVNEHSLIYHPRRIDPVTKNIHLSLNIPWLFTELVRFRTFILFFSTFDIKYDDIYSIWVACHDIEFPFAGVGSTLTF